MPCHRRQFLAHSAALASTFVANPLGYPPWAAGADPLLTVGAAAIGDTNQRIVAVDVATGDELQRSLQAHAGSGSCLRIAKPVSLTCQVNEEDLGAEKSIHALLIPHGVQLDLNGSTLLLDLRSNSYGVRLSNDSAIRNGTIRVVRSEGKGSQACWHSGISIGAAYGDGGTPEKPGLFATVSRWAVENITIDQQFAASAIQLMSESCHGLIRNIRILDSDKALLGIGLDWGTVGPITTEDKEVPRMKKLWEQGQIYSTHPHDVLIENIRVGKLGRNVDGNDAGVRCSACHRITIRNLEVEDAATAVAIFGGDFGYEFARPDLRGLDHQGYLIDGVKIAKARRFGIVLNGMADNIWRSCRNHGYVSVRDPVHPGLDRVTIRNAVLRGDDSPQSQGLYATSLTAGTIDDLDVSGFAIGVRVKDWVNGLQFRRTQLAHNDVGKRIDGATEPPTGVRFE